MSELKICNTCLYQNPYYKWECLSERCDYNLSGWRSRDSSQTSSEEVKEASPKGGEFSLDKLIDDHWQYNKGLIGYCLPYGVDGWETDDILRLVEFAYKQSGKHFWKHCKEHYNIKDADNE